MKNPKWKKLSITCFALTALCTFSNKQQTIYADENTINAMISYKNEEGKQKVLDAAENVNEVLQNVDMVEASLTEQQLVELKKDPNIELVDTQEAPMSLADSTPTLAPIAIPTWNHTLTNVPVAWNAGIFGNKVKVAVIDTGINLIDDLPNIAARVSFVADDPTTVIKESDNVDRGGKNGTGHGTSVAAIIGAKIGGYLSDKKTADIIGVAPNVQLYSLKYADGTTMGTTTEIIKSIDWAIENKMDIINISSGLHIDVPSLRSAIQKAYNAGILIVASAGNEGNNRNVTYPARYSQVIAVSSINSKQEFSAFSNTGTSMNLTAPGESVPSISKDGDLIYVSGTSFAAPHVTGILALLKQQYPLMSAKELRSKLYNTAIDLGIAGIDNLYGHGLVQYPQTELIPLEELTGSQIVDVTDRTATVRFEFPNNKNASKVAIFLDDQLLTSTTSSTYKVQGLKPSMDYTITLKVVATDGSTTAGTALNVHTLKDKTPPAEVTKLSATSIQINAVTIKWKKPATVDYKQSNIYVNNKKIAATKESTYTIRNLKADKVYKLAVKTEDEAGNISPGVALTVQTPMMRILKAPSVKKVSDRSVSIAGTAQANAKLYIYKGNQKLAQTTVQTDGSYNAAIKKQAANTQLAIYIKDSNGNSSTVQSLKVLDKTPPGKPKVNKLTSQATYVSGTAEPFSTIQMQKGKTVLSKTTAKASGKFTLKIKKQKKNSTFDFYAIDQAHNRSKSTLVKVES
ncbi:S8 family serine peptidase [Viridibacillus sp. YIM B01967]|uniref:S8 family serine peptidase n=1 Tax=Viridibacillus soli TaxID=2798301 RepID=A0ABS1HA57_9BACL|nr:S8 family serine peptidase [Viridibacillus soli]MBK3496290.1 S8 family serine peptidase [Viridibacillus soli]